jgi:hexosaminidase
MTALFPGKYFHIGGAECSETRWEKCPSCLLRMKTDSMNSTNDLHKYFVRRISHTLDSLGKGMVGWDEILKDTLLSKEIVMSWHDVEGGITATQRKLQTVMSPAKFCNFDLYQANPRSEPLATGGLLTLEQVYNFEPVPADLPKQAAKYIIGSQANVWTQYMKTPEYVEYMVFPRAAALAEVVWSPKASRNYPWFRKRLLEQLKRYDAAGIRYCNAEFKSSAN